MAGWHVHLDFLEDWLDGNARRLAELAARALGRANERYEASMRPIS